MEEIWTHWESHYKQHNVDYSRITKDGIINDLEYKDPSTNSKILFILKDSNKFPGGDLRSLLKEGPKHQMWFTISRWASGILENFPPYEEIDKRTTLKKSLSKIAIINIKKLTGKSKSNDTSLNKYAKLDKDLLRNQILNINPDLIIACGTFNQIIWVLDIDLSFSEKSKYAVDNLTKKPVIIWRHPNRADNKKTYAELAQILKDIKYKST